MECQQPVNLPRLYIEFLQHNVLPVAEDMNSKYEEWWYFKPDSLLKKYLEKKEIVLDDYFLPSALWNTVIRFVMKNDMIDPDNHKCIRLTDSNLRQCFKNIENIYLPELKQHLQCHVNILSDDSVRYQLQKNVIINDITIETPKDIIFQSPFSKFWVIPELNMLFNERKKRTYLWSEINDLFRNLCYNNPLQIKPVQNNFFKICSNSVLYSVFNFDTFHESQIPHILERCTLFMGQSKNIQNFCPNLNLTVKNIDFYNALDYSIIVCNRFVPPFEYPISI